MCLAIVALSSLGTLAPHTAAQNPPGQKIDVMIVPDITIQTEDYADARKKFCTKLLRDGPAPHQQDCKTSKPPVGVSEIDFPSSALRLRAWLNRPSTQIPINIPPYCSCTAAFVLNCLLCTRPKSFGRHGSSSCFP